MIFVYLLATNNHLLHLEVYFCPRGRSCHNFVTISTKTTHFSTQRDTITIECVEGINYMSLSSTDLLATPEEFQLNILASSSD